MQTKNTHLVATAPSVERLTKMVANYFYGSQIRIEGENVYSVHGLLKSYRVTIKKGRYRFERIKAN